MSTDFHKVLVKDSRIADLTSDIGYGVIKGASQITCSRFNSISTGVTNQIFNIQIPSQETLVSRQIYWKATIKLKLSSVVPQDDVVETQLIDYANSDCLGPFPLNQLCSTMQCTINNTTMNVNTRDVLPALLRMIDDEELSVYDNMCPNAYDSYLNYADIGDAGNNFNPPNSPFSGFECRGYNKGPKARGSFALDNVTSNDGEVPLVARAIGADASLETAYITFTSSEPLIGLSPWLFGDSDNKSAIYGLQTLNFQFNLGDTNRVWRRRAGRFSPAPTDAFTVELVSITDSSLNFTFLSPHPSDLLSSRCITPYYDMPRYISTGGEFKAGFNPDYRGGPLLPTKQQYTFSSISMNQIPDKLIIFARNPISTQKSGHSDSFFSIENISINWNNNSGLLSSHTMEDLYAVSKASGSNQSFDEFRGYGFSKGIEGADIPGNNAGRYIKTCGSVLMIDVGTHLPLSQDFYAPGSIGNFVLQFSITLKNFNIVPSPNIELVCMTMNSGVLACERGSSSVYSALLSKSDVLDASASESISSQSVKRMIGGGFLDRLKTNFSHIMKSAKDVAPIIKSGLQLYSKTGSKYGKEAKEVADVLSTLGYGGMSAGNRSGGTLSSRLR